MAGDKTARALRAGILTVITAAVLAFPPARAAEPQPHFSTPDAAVEALVATLEKHDEAALATLLGPGSEKLVHSGDPVKDRQEGDRFLDSYAAHHALKPDGTDRVTLEVGNDNWPLPIPIIQEDGQWRFDSTTGAQEIVDRRIGRNEIEAIRFCLAYVDAQKAYFDLFKQVTGKGQYAQRLASTPGNYDGLYWPSATNIPESPLTPLVQSAIEEGYPGQIEAGKPVPYQGYYYRVLTAQGPNAPGGAKTYLREGKLVDGFALIAWPATYDASGIMTFVVNQDGIVFQKDLGPNTTARANAVKSFDPGLDWARIDVEDK